MSGNSNPELGPKPNLHEGNDQLNTSHPRPARATAAEPMPEWGTIREAATRRAVSTKTIRRYIAQGLVQAERFGPRLIRVNLNSLNAVGHSLANDAL